METLLNQIAEEYQNGEPDPKCHALKEILLSGFYRSGLSKVYAYLDGMDRIKDGYLFMCFLKTDSRPDFPWEEYLPYMEIELNAYGAVGTVKKVNNGFEIFFPEEKIGVVVYLMPVPGTKHTVLSYVSSPLPYETRKAVLKEKWRRERVREKIDNFVDEYKTEKRGPGRPRKPEIVEDDGTERWRQPTLFDF